MPRKDDVRKNGSKNDRAAENRKYDADSPIPSPSSNDIHEVMLNDPRYANAANLINDIKGSSNYSSFVRKANERSSGWYSTIANAVPGVSNIHNALLGRDSAEDYLRNNNLSWGDMEGYNDVKLLGRSSSSLGGLMQQGNTWLNNIGSDLGKLYSNQKS